MTGDRLSFEGTPSPPGGFRESFDITLVVLRRVEVGRIVAGAWGVRKDDLKLLSPLFRESFDVSRLIERREEVEGRVGEDVLGVCLCSVIS